MTKGKLLMLAVFLTSTAIIYNLGMEHPQLSIIRLAHSFLFAVSMFGVFISLGIIIYDLWDKKFGE